MFRRMTGKVTRKAYVLRSIARSTAALIVVIAMCAWATMSGTGQVHLKFLLERVNAATPSPIEAMGPNPLIFLPGVAYDSGGYTGTSIAIADLNGDGKLDLVMGNKCSDSGCQSGHGSVGVLLGNGDGTFQPAVAYGSGGISRSAVAVADVNGDGKPDVLVVNCSDANCDGSVGVLLGNGDGTFQAAVAYGSGGTFPSALAVADVNGDGKPDVVVANNCSDSNCDGSVGVLLGNGDGSFQTAVAYSSGGNVATSIAVADVNSDGKPDLIVSNDCAGSCSTIKGAVAVLLGNGNGTFQTAASYESGGIHANSVAVADVNADGKLDLLVCNLVQNVVGVLLGNGNGTFQPAVTYSSNGGFASTAVAVAVADVNGDGKPDLLVVNQSFGGDGNNGGAVAVLLGNGDGTFQSAVNYPTGGYQSLRVVLADVNGDGRQDLLVANRCNQNNLDCDGPNNKIRGTVTVLLNNNGAPATTSSLVSSANPADINSAVTYTAKVNPTAGGTVQGTVTFHDGFATIATVTLSGNQATCTALYSTAGTHSISATYSGDLDHAAGSTSATLTEIIVKPRATKTVVTTSGSPSFVGKPVTFTAKVTTATGTIPNGEMVTFYDGTIARASVALTGGIATYTTSSLVARTHTIKATYVGDVNFKTSSGTVMQVVEKYATATTLASSQNPSNFGQAVTFTAIVKTTGPYAVTGKVKFLDGTTPIGYVTLSAGAARLTKSALAVGTHTITATYAGDSANATSISSAVNQTVQ